MVALGGALGSVGRYGVGLALTRYEAFPIGTLLANILGSLLPASNLHENWLRRFF